MWRKGIHLYFLRFYLSYNLILFKNFIHGLDDIVENVLVQQIDDTKLVILHNWWKKTTLKISFNSAGHVRRANLVAQVNLPWSFCFCTETSFYGPLLWPSPVLLYLSFDTPTGGISTPDDHFKVSALLKPLTSRSLYSQHLPLCSSYFIEKIDPSEGLEPPSPAPKLPSCRDCHHLSDSGLMKKRDPTAIPSTLRTLFWGLCFLSSISTSQLPFKCAYPSQLENHLLDLIFLLSWPHLTPWQPHLLKNLLCHPHCLLSNSLFMPMQ